MGVLVVRMQLFNLATRDRQNSCFFHGRAAEISGTVETTDRSDERIVLTLQAWTYVHEAECVRRRNKLRDGEDQ